MMNLFAGQQWRCRHREHTRGHSDHQLDGHESEQAPGFGDGQGSLACCSPWGPKELDMTEQLSRLILGITYSNFVLSHRRSKNIY